MTRSTLAAALATAALSASITLAVPSTAHAAVAKSAKTAASTCRASYYAYGSRTANGERYNPRGLTAAHKSFPFGSRVKVTNTRTGKSVVVRINDRGPFVKGRCIDLSKAAFTKIGSTSSGVLSVRVQRIS